MKINKFLFGLIFLFSPTLYNQSLVIENDTPSLIVIRLNKSTLPTPLLSNAKLELNPEKIQTIEFKYKGYPDIAFKKPKNLQMILDNITPNKDALLHVEPGKLGGLQLGKIEYIEPSSQKIQNKEINLGNQRIHKLILDLLGVEESDIEKEPLTKDAAAKILDISSTSDTSTARKAFSSKMFKWYENPTSNDANISKQYSAYLLKALNVFEP